MSHHTLAAVSRRMALYAVAFVAGLLSVHVEADPPSAGGNQSALSAIPSQQAGPSAPQVTIQAQSQQDLQRRASNFVQGLVRSGRFYDTSIPTWHAALCFEVAGLPKAQGEFVLSRLSMDAG